jgi:hypothetical protein
MDNQSRTAAQTSCAPATWPHCLSLLPSPGAQHKRRSRTRSSSAPCCHSTPAPAQLLFGGGASRWRPGSWSRSAASPLCLTHARLPLTGSLSLSRKHKRRLARKYLQHTGLLCHTSCLSRRWWQSMAADRCGGGGGAVAGAIGPLTLRAIDCVRHSAVLCLRERENPRGPVQCCVSLTRRRRRRAMPQRTPGSRKPDFRARAARGFAVSLSQYFRISLRALPTASSMTRNGHGHGHEGGVRVSAARRAPEGDQRRRRGPGGR